MFERIFQTIPKLNNRIMLILLDLLSRRRTEVRRAFAQKKGRQSADAVLTRMGLQSADAVLTRMGRQSAEDTALAGSYIEAQRTMAHIPYGRVTMAYAGCEIIAVYNALLHLTGREPSLNKLIGTFTDRGMVLSGRFGTSPLAMGRFFRSMGYSVQVLTDRTLFDRAAADKETFILTYYNDIRDIRSQLHTVCFTRDQGVLTVHNVFGNGRIVHTAGVDDFLLHLKGGHAQGLMLLMIR